MSKQKYFIVSYPFSINNILVIELKEICKNVTFFAETFCKNPKMDIYFCPFSKIFKKFCQKCNICY